MKLEKETTNEQQQSNRKVSVWSREKIYHLIELYKKHECLWNHWHESYKSREKRNRAIETICTQLRISKFDFGKKIHNLRNQFNTEMKKLEQRIEESGGEVAMNDRDANAPSPRCKWSHFESLMFLRHVIEPRPGGYQQSTYQAPKKMRIRFDYNSAEDDVNVTMVPSNSSTSNDDISQYQYEDTGTDDATAEDYQNFDNDLSDVVQTPREETMDQKYQPPPPPTSRTLSALNSVLASNPRTFIQMSTNPKTSQTCQHSTLVNPTPHTEIINLSQNNSSIVELNSSNLAVVSANPTSLISSSTSVSATGSTASSNTATASNTSVPIISSVTSVASKTTPLSTTAAPVRDQWDAFGELVANEFRNLNSDISRKRLKRKIMHAMLEVGEEDDVL